MPVVSVTTYAKTTLHQSPHFSHFIVLGLFVILMMSRGFVTPLPYEVDNNDDDISGEEAAILKDLLYPECQSLGLLASIINKGEQKSTFLQRL
jgi:hypothetical protein